MTALGPAGLAAGAGWPEVGLVLTRGLQEAGQADQSYRRLEAVLRATGASGLTAREITNFADGLEQSTLATAESVQDAASALATFHSIAGDTFTRALTLAQDPSAVFGQDLAPWPPSSARRWRSRSRGSRHCAEWASPSPSLSAS